MSGEGCKKSAKPILHPKYRAENNAVLVSNGYGIGHLPSVAAVAGVCLFVFSMISLAQIYLLH